MKNGRAFFLLLMGMIVSLYTAFVVIGQDGPAMEAGEGEGQDGSAEMQTAEEGDASDQPVEVAQSEPASEDSGGWGEEESAAESEVVVEEEIAEPESDQNIFAEEAPVEETVVVVIVDEESDITDPAAGEEVPVADEADTVEPLQDDITAEDVTVIVVTDPVEVFEGEGETVFVGVDEDEGEIPGASAEKVEGSNTISISLDDVEMADVVRMFTRISGANIIASPTNLVGRVTANLDDVQWQGAMETILDMHGLALMEAPPGSKIFRIDPKVPGAPEPMKVKTFFMKYAQVSNSTAVVRSMLAPGATLQAFPSRNALVVRSTASNLGEIEEIIDSIDVLRDQVFIEAKFMELNDSAIKDLGINWQVLQGYTLKAENLGINLTETRNWDTTREESATRTDNRAYEDVLTKNYDIDGMQYEDSTTTYEEAPPGSGVYVPLVSLTPTREISDTITRSQDRNADASDSFTKGIADVRTAILGVDDFRVVLSALKQMNGVQIVSNPKLIVANEERATIHIGQVERPFEAVVTPATQVEASTTKYTPGAPINFGVSLEVVPTINTASNITVMIEPELTRFVVNRIAPDGATYPVVASKKIKTMFCLESGKTVAIGGLTETVEQENIKKIPLLGDIPLIGKYLFSHTHTEREQKETIIFVTVGLAHPDTVNEYDGLPEDTELTHHKLLEKRLKRLKFHDDLEKQREKVEEKLQKSERARAQLAE